MTIIRTAESYGQFRVTYETATEESAEAGDWEDTGWLDWQFNPVDEYHESNWDFRDLLDKLSGHYAEGDGDTVPRWITIYPESDIWLDPKWRDLGEDLLSASASIHRPGWITDASWLRVCRLMGWRQR